MSQDLSFDRIWAAREHRICSAGSHPTRRARILRAGRLRHYQRSLAMLEERLPESPLVGGLRDELAGFLRERAATAATV